MQDGFISTSAQALRALADVLEPAEALEADFKSACDELSAHIQKVSARIMVERSGYGQKVRALTDEQDGLKRQIAEIEEQAAHYRRIGLNGGRFPTPSTKRQEARISEIESERERLQEDMSTVRATPEEGREYSRLYDVAKSKEAEAIKAAAAIAPALEAGYNVMRERCHIAAPLYGVIPDALFSYAGLLSSVSGSFEALRRRN